MDNTLTGTKADKCCDPLFGKLCNCSGAVAHNSPSARGPLRAQMESERTRDQIAGQPVEIPQVTMN